MDVEAVVSVVIRRLTYLLFEESKIFSQVIDDVKLVRESLKRMQNFLIDTEDKKEREVKEWVENFLAVAYQAEDAIESFVLRGVHTRRMGFGVKCFFISEKLMAVADPCQTIKEIKKTIESLGYDWTQRVRESNRGKPLRNQELSVSRSSYQDEGLTQKQQKSPTSVNEESDVIGFEEDKKNLVSLLTDFPVSSRLRFISIVGMGGCGKTTLAREIYNSREITNHFDCHAWVSAFENLTNVLLSILKQTADSPIDKQLSISQEALVLKLRQNLQKKRYLVVLDDVQSYDALRGLRVAFPNENNGSRVILTTRLEGIAGSTDPYRLKPLNEEDAWKLLLKRVRLPGNVQFSDSEILNLKRKFLPRCEGLPLAIVMLGGILPTKNASYEAWLKVLEHPGWQPKWYDLLDILALSYNDLPFHLRPCLLYFGLFPKEYEIPVRRLFRLWLAEGFVKQSPDMTPEDTVERYLEELVNRSMIKITTRRIDGSPKQCLMHSLLHDFVLSKAGDIGFFHIHRTLSDHEPATSPKLGVRRLAQHGDIKDYPSKQPSYIQHLRSYLSFNNQEKGFLSQTLVGNFLSEVLAHRGFVLLRVLDLESVYKPKLPKNLGKLYYLRYLGLRRTILDALPHSVGDLRYLETLDVKHTNIRSLPISIWKMKHLRHLCLSKTRLDMSVQKHCSFLTQLQTLSGLFVDKKSPVKNGLNRLINLKKLDLTYHLDSVQELHEWIARLASLQSLTLRSENKDGRPSKLELKPVSNLKNLTQLDLVGNLPELHDLDDWPPRLRVLSMTFSNLKKDPMPILARLPSLTALSLLDDSYNGKEMVCPREGFGTLRILKLWRLNELEEWTVEEGAMQNLRQSEIRCCNKLKELPEKLLNLSAIEEVILTSMPKGILDNLQADEHKRNLITLNNVQL